MCSFKKISAVLGKNICSSETEVLKHSSNAMSFGLKVTKVMSVIKSSVRP